MKTAALFTLLLLVAIVTEARFVLTTSTFSKFRIFTESATLKKEQYDLKLFFSLFYSRHLRSGLNVLKINHY